MANSVSRLKNTDSLAQWSEKINYLMDSVDDFVTNTGSFTSTGPTNNDLVIYDGSWKNKTLIAGDMIFDGSYSNATQFKFKLDPLAISSKTEITVVDTANDFLLIWDATDSALKKVKPSNISSQVGGSNTQVQFNDGGSTLGGDSGLTYNKTTDILTIAGGLVVDTSVLVVDGSTNRVGIVNASPGYPLDVAGDVNTTGTYRIGGSILFNSATSLNSTVVSSSLTTVGTLTSLTVSGAASFQTSVSALNLTVTNTITGSISGNAATVTNGVYTTGDQTIGGTKTFSSTISANISGTAYNITQYTINQNLGTSNNVSFNTVSDASGNLREIPQNSKTSSYSIISSDSGKHISITTGGITINTSTAFTAGQVVTIYNNSSNNQTITSTGVTIYLAGTASTGNRTLGQRGIATILCVSSNTYVISGSGLT